MTTSGTRKGLILALACLAQFMVTLDLAIVNVALPSIQRDLGLRESSLQWVVIAYGLLLGGFLLLGGRLGDLLGRRRILLAGLTLFTGASLIAGLANSARVLVGARALEGFGAALLVPSALAILAVTFAQGKERNRALGIFGAVGASSASVGVIAGGLLTDGPGWRWIFFINVPIGLLLMATAAWLLTPDRTDRRARRYDAAGAATVTSGLLLLVYGLNRGAEHGWGTMATLGLFVASAVLLLAFGWIETRSASPLVPVDALRNQTMVAADLAAFFAFGAFIAFIFLGTLLMQQGLGYSPTRTGLAWLATSLTAFVAAGLTGARLATAVGVRRLLVVAMALLALGTAWLIRVPPGAAFATDLLPALVLVGIAVGLTAPAIQIGALTGVTGPRVGLASGLVETMREIGGAVGVAAVSTILVTRAQDLSATAAPAARQAALFSGFHAAFVVIVLLAGTGATIASIAFPDGHRDVPVRTDRPAVLVPEVVSADD